MRLGLKHYKIRICFAAVITALFFLLFNISASAEDDTEIEFYNHNYGYHVSVPVKFKEDIYNANENILRVFFRKEDAVSLNDNIMFQLRSDNYFSRLPEEQRKELVAKELSLGNVFFDESYNSHAFMVTHFNGLIRGLPGFRKDVVTIEHNILNGKTFWVCHYYIYNANNVLVGEGKVFFTVYEGFSYTIYVFNRNGMISEVPEVESTILSVRVGRMTGEQIRFIWGAVCFVCVMFFASVIWIITRPRKLSPRQEWKREYKKEKKAIKKGLPLPQEGAAENALIQTDSIPLLESPETASKKVFRAAVSELNAAAEFADRKKLLYVLDIILDRDLKEDVYYEDEPADYENAEPLSSSDSLTGSEAAESAEDITEAEPEIIGAEQAVWDKAAMFELLDVILGRSGQGEEETAAETAETFEYDSDESYRELLDALDEILERSEAFSYKDSAEEEAVHEEEQEACAEEETSEEGAEQSDAAASSEYEADGSMAEEQTEDDSVSQEILISILDDILERSGSAEPEES